MPSLPWKKSKSSRISRFVSDFQQSPKHGGSLVVETGFPTSLIDLFVKNRNRLKKQSSKRNHDNIINNIPKQISSSSSSSSSHPPPRRRVSSPPPPPSPHPPPSSLPSFPRHRSLPVNLDLEEERVTSKIEEVAVDEDKNDDGDCGARNGGGGCVLMVVAVKVFVVAVLALSTKKLAVGITLSAFTLIFLELAVARVLALLNICPNAAEVRMDSLIGKLIGTKKKKSHQEIVEEESSTVTPERKNKVTFEIIEEPIEETKATEDSKPVVEEKEVVTIRDVVFKNEKSKSAKLKSKLVKKIVPTKIRSYKKKRKMQKMKKGEEEIEIIGGGGEEEEEGSVTEVSSLYSEDRVESEISERDDVSSNPPLLESCEEEEIKGGGRETKGDLTKVIGLIVIVLAGLLIGKVLAIGLTLSWCLILRVFCRKSRTSL